MILNIRRIIPLLFAIGISTVMATSFFGNNLFLSVVLTIFYLTVPGLLILFAAKRINGSGHITTATLSVTLSLAFLIFGSIVTNQLLPVFGIDRPLDKIPLSVAINVPLVVLFGFAYWRNRNNQSSITISKYDLSTLDITLLALLVIMPIQAVLGATILNNGGSGILSIITAIEVVAISFFAVLFRNKINQRIIFPVALFLTSVSVLLLLSMRSNHVLGWDINQEYYTLELVKANGRWVFDTFSNAYNACLSITTLPAALTGLTGVDGLLLFKIVYPALFSLITIAIYKIFTKYTSPVFAFMGVVILIAQPQYILQITMLARQEIALIFVATAYMLIFTSSMPLSKFNKTILAVLSLSIITSHYSTAYVFILSLIVMYAWNRLINFRNRNRNRKLEYSNQSAVSLRFILILLLATFLWNAQFIPASSNLSYVAGKVIKNFENTLNSDLRSDSAYSAIWNGGNSQSVSGILREHVESLESDGRTVKTEDYSPVIALPQANDSLLPQPFSRITIIFPIISALLKVCLILGVLILFFKKKLSNSIEALQGASLAYLIGLGLFFLLPFISIAYNFERLALQALFILGLPMIWGLAFITKRFKPQKSQPIFMSAIISMYFIYTLGLTSQLFGGVAPIQYNNYGLFISRFYTYRSDVQAIEWLSDNKVADNNTYADTYSSLKLLPYGGIKEDEYNTDILPPYADDGYIFTSKSNLSDNMAFGLISNKEISFTYPIMYIDRNENSIYSNGYSGIYR